MQKLKHSLALLLLTGVGACADVILSQPSFITDGRTSQVFAPNTGFIVYERFQSAQDAHVNRVDWTGGFFASGQVPPPEGNTWTFAIYDDNGGLPGTLTDSVTVPFSTPTRQFIGNGTLGGLPTGFYNFSVMLPGTLFIDGGATKWLAIYVEGNGASAFAWTPSNVGDGVSKQRHLASGNYNTYVDRAVTLYGTTAVPEPSELVLLSGIGILAGLVRKSRATATKQQA
ncbi:hypothetical protein F183_A06250 [Bryobacterales bacterium F-183]|nr:hypothetical protein F183_A06250 [Bryobacterales bacterium F-183]